MLIRRMVCFLTIFQIVSGNGDNFPGNSFLMRLLNRTLPKSREFSTVQQDTGCNYKCSDLGRTRPRSSDGGSNGTAESYDLESASGKFSIFNFLSDDDEGQDDGNDSEPDEKANKDEEDEEDEEEDIGFFGSEEEISSDKLEGTKGESFLKQYHRQNLRLHGFVFPLLMAYKLKFFTVIPLLLGALVLLVGTTGIAGFFFALFAAALGIHVKSHQQ